MVRTEGFIATVPTGASMPEIRALVGLDAVGAPCAPRPGEPSYEVVGRTFFPSGAREVALRVPEAKP